MMKRSMILGSPAVPAAAASGRRSLSRVSRSSLDSGRKFENADSGYIPNSLPQDTKSLASPGLRKWAVNEGMGSQTKSSKAVSAMTVTMSCSGRTEMLPSFTT
jgi:hypothetical protein